MECTCLYIFGGLW